MQRKLFFLAAAMLQLGSLAQQLPQLTQYTVHDYLYNPAVAGSREQFEMHSAHRNQWVGIQDAPRTFMLSLTTPVGRNMGLGGFMYTDHVGPTRRTGAQVSYAYHLRLTEKMRLGFGLSLGLQQFVIDGSKITFHDGYDPIMDGQVRGSTVPDATFALYLYHPDWWFGAAAPQLLKNKIVFYDDRDATLSELAGHYFVMGGYRLQLSDDLRLEPSFLVKYVDPVPVKIDLTATLRYKEQIWLGATYRTNDAIGLMVGYWLKKTFQFGYSYDITTTNLNRYSNGTHEVMLGITFGKKRPEPRPTIAADAAPVPVPATP